VFDFALTATLVDVIDASRFSKCHVTPPSRLVAIPSNCARVSACPNISLVNPAEKLSKRLGMV
jgi:hypothetical protein